MGGVGQEGRAWCYGREMWQKKPIQSRYKIATMLLHIHKFFYRGHTTACNRTSLHRQESERHYIDSRGGWGGESDVTARPQSNANGNALHAV